MNTRRYHFLPYFPKFSIRDDRDEGASGDFLPFAAGLDSCARAERCPPRIGPDGDSCLPLPLEIHGLSCSAPEIGVAYGLPFDVARTGSRACLSKRTRSEAPAISVSKVKGFSPEIVRAPRVGALGVNGVSTVSREPNIAKVVPKSWGFSSVSRHPQSWEWARADREKSDGSRELAQQIPVSARPDPNQGEGRSHCYPGRN